VAQPRPSKQRTNRLARHRIDPVGRQFGERLEHEEPLAKSRVRNHKSRLLELSISEQHQIEIERARRS
jgi:hypothetical protein